MYYSEKAGQRHTHTHTQIHEKKKHRGPYAPNYDDMCHMTSYPISFFLFFSGTLNIFEAKVKVRL